MFEHNITILYDEMAVSPECKQATVFIFLRVVPMLCFVCSVPCVMLCSHETLGPHFEAQLGLCNVDLYILGHRSDTRML